jgi:hypothetical protein
MRAKISNPGQTKETERGIMPSTRSQQAPSTPTRAALKEMQGDVETDLVLPGTPSKMEKVRRTAPLCFWCRALPKYWILSSRPVSHCHFLDLFQLSSDLNDSSKT